MSAVYVEHKLSITALLYLSTGWGVTLANFNAACLRVCQMLILLIFL